MQDQDYTKDISETNQPAVSRQEKLQRLLIEGAVLKELTALHNAFKAEVAAEFSPGDRAEVKNRQGLKMGSASMSLPNKAAVCNDRSVLLAMATEAGAEVYDTLPDPNSERGQLALKVLEEHAPELLEPIVSKSDVDAVAKNVLEQWQITGELPAGWEIVDASKPRFTVTPGRTSVAKAAVNHLVGDVRGLISRKALEKGGEE